MWPRCIFRAASCSSSRRSTPRRRSSNRRSRNKDYREVYIDLSSASVAGSKVFVMDRTPTASSAHPATSRADNFDTAEHAVAFDGDWKKAKMSQADYPKAFATDGAYARALEMLINQLKSTT